MSGGHYWDATIAEIEAWEATTDGYSMVDITNAATGEENPVLSPYASTSEHYESYRRAALGKWGRAAEDVGTTAGRAGRKANRAVYGVLWAFLDVLAFVLIWYLYLVSQSPSLADWIYKGITPK
jgi:hypothetical protein